MSPREQTVQDLMALGAERAEAEALADQGADSETAADPSPRRGRRRVAGRLRPR